MNLYAMLFFQSKMLKFLRANSAREISLILFVRKKMSRKLDFFCVLDWAFFEFIELEITVINVVLRIWVNEPVVLFCVSASISISYIFSTGSTEQFIFCMSLAMLSNFLLIVEKFAAFCGFTGIIVFYNFLASVTLLFFWNIEIRMFEFIMYFQSISTLMSHLTNFTSEYLRLMLLHMIFE